MTNILEVDGVTKYFGGFRAVNNASIKAEAGTICGLIGPNGAGKSTMFNIIAGVHAPNSGRVTLSGVDVTGLPAHQMFDHGLLRTFQIPHEFSNVRVINNLLMVPGDQQGEDLFNALFRPKKFKNQEAEYRKKALDILEFIGLSHVKYELAGNLSGGQKKLLELGRTLMVDAKIVLLDELGAGVNRSLLNTLADNIRKLNEELGKTFLIIEHNMDFISRLCHSVTVMVEGAVVTEGTPGEVLNDPMVIEAYFGGGKHRSADAGG